MFSAGLPDVTEVKVAGAVASQDADAGKVLTVHVIPSVEVNAVVPEVCTAKNKPFPYVTALT